MRSSHLRITLMAFTCVKLCSSSRLSSRPTPESLKPPNGTPQKCRADPLIQMYPASRFRDPVRAPYVAGPHRAGQAEGDRVGDSHRLVLVAERHDRQHWPEHLGLAQRAIRGDVGQDGWRNEIALATAAGRPPPPVRSRAPSRSPVSISRPTWSRCRCVMTGPIWVRSCAGSPTTTLSARRSRACILRRPVTRG